MKKQTVATELAFVCSDGHKLQTLSALVHKLESMSPSMFSHHVSARHNDFANWIDDVFREKELAQEVKKQDSARDMAIVIKREITPRIHDKHIHHKIKHMEKNFEHMTRYDRTPRNTDIPPVSNDLKDKLLDFVFGLVIGLLLGIIIAKSALLF